MKAVDEALVQVVVIDEVVLDDEAFEVDDLMSLPEKDKDVYIRIETKYAGSCSISNFKMLCN